MELIVTVYSGTSRKVLGKTEMTVKDMNHPIVRLLRGNARSVTIKLTNTNTIKYERKYDA